MLAPWLKALSRKAQLKKAKSNRERRITLLLVDSHGNTRSTSIALRTIATIFAGLLLSFGTLGYFVRSYVLAQKELSELHYLKNVAEAQRQQILELQEEYRKLSERLRQTELLQSQTREMLQREGVITQNLTEPEARIASPTERNVTLASRSATAIRDLGRALALLSDSAQNLESQIARLEESSKDLHQDASRVVAYLRAQPNIWPVRGEITSGFGWRPHPVTGKRDFHSGVDIAAGYWTPIKAAADGIVRFAGYKYGYGRVVIIDHGYGLETAYAHCISIKVKAGQKVTRGETIAYVGDSGTATGPHLHYEVHKDGVLMNPLNYLPK
ncbi:MAG: peptidoglycan DD-metalloendopeptidase family protein [Candidatus Fermentithermobacillus carboniphilus]|uniref:Peptidoglycan DD-metalloendopeptidase family protein n=1 Tax=Candidatus Fermentithermobacillus carboniphilus TaxID=3085328 RepID=A0AAT9L9Y0_9FIRM|nr:MAG: peptidoglycan DD-metalloendopeptidase family protein [Candidatus Fermentithermobacillus carboniphilus]